jgi:uncharacterized protein YsxB (DUF464 family)
MIALIVFSVASISEAETAFQVFYQQQNDAYASYRAALFQTNKDDADASLKTASQFIMKWKALAEQYADAPPEIFAADSEWKSTLETIGEIAAKGKSEIEAGNLAEAHEILEAVRDELGELRRRNHVVVFSDYVNGYHEVMENLLSAGYTAETLDAAALNSIREQFGVLDFLAEELLHNAPQEYRDNEKYQQLEQGLLASLQSLRKALDENVSEEIVKAISNLKAPYAKLFLNFG